MNDVPVVGRKDILRALNENHVQGKLIVAFFLGDIPDSLECARVQIHLMQISMIVNICKHAAAEWCVLQIIKQAIDLVEFAFFVLMLDTKLITIGFTNTSIWVSPLVPNVLLDF